MVGTLKSTMVLIAIPTLAAMAVPMLASSPASAAECARTINHDAVLVQHPARTHPESLWSHQVVDQPYVPGTPQVEETSHLQFDYIDGDAAPEGQGWWKSGQQWTIEDQAGYTDFGWMRHVVDEPRVPAVPEQPEVAHVLHHDAVAHTETVVDEPAYDETVIDHPAYNETVIDHPAYDEVAPDGYAYEQKTTGKIKYLDTPDWNGEEHEPGLDKGWSRVSALDTVIHHDAVTHVVHHAAVTHVEHHDAVTHVEHHDAVTHLVHHDAVTHVEHHDAVTHLVHHDAVTHDVTIVDQQAYDEKVIDSPYVPGTPEQAEVSHPELGWTRSNTDGPEGDGWFLTGQSFDHEAVTHTRYQWMRKVVDQPYVPAVPETLEQSHTETTEGTSAQAPGEGWVKVEGSEVLVEDQAAYTETVKDGWVECVAPTGPDASKPVPGGKAEVAGVEGRADVAGVSATSPQPTPKPRTAPHLAASQQLPNTGAPAWLGGAGLVGALVTAAGVVVLRRARTTRD